MGRNPLYAFFLKAALWLPLCLALWYWKAEWFNSPAAIVSGWIMRGLFPGWVEAVEWSQRTISLVTTLRVPMVPGVNEGKVAVMVAEANPLLYTYGLPLFAALLLVLPRPPALAAETPAYVAMGNSLAFGVGAANPGSDRPASPIAAMA